MSDDELESLRSRAKLLGIVNYGAMTRGQLRKVISERERGADPHQAESKAKEMEE